MKKKTVVRVVGYKPKDSLLECLRYAGHVKVHAQSMLASDGSAPAESRWPSEVFDILPPANVDSEAWAKMNAERMTSFGYNAVPAPEWGWCS